MIEPADDIYRDQPLPLYYRRIKGSGATAVMSAAMFAVGEILEPRNTAVEIEQSVDRSRDCEGLDLHFGDLPTLE